MKPGRAALLCAVLTWAAASGALAEAPVVTKVEPPSWWRGHSVSPVRVLLRGRNLAGATIGGAAGTAVGRTSVNAAGTYAFVDVTIAPQAATGLRSLTVATPGGRTTAAFEVLDPLPRAGRFQGFGPEDVIYLVMPDRFANGDTANDDPPAARGMTDRTRRRYYHGGDLRGVLDHLPYLKDLGVTAIWLTPVYDNVNHLNDRELLDGEPFSDYHGYGAVDFYAVDEHLGTVATFRELVDAAHRVGIKVIQDQVANHSGPSHPWVEDPPTPTWYNWTAPGKHFANTWQVWTLADPHAGPGLRQETLAGWFVDILPDLNQDDPEVARYITQNTLWWVGMTGLDGIRQDTLPYAPRPFWHDWTAAIKREYPALRVVGELFDGDAALVSFFQGGVARFDGVDSGIDTLFDFPLYFPLRRAFAEGKPLREVAAMLARDHLYRDPSVLVTFLGLHDVGRFMNETGASVAGLNLAHTFLLTARGTPLVYYGDEIGMTGGGDPDNRRDFPGGFSGDSQDAFAAASRSPDQRAVFDNVQRLARLRRELAALQTGRQVTLFANEQAWAYARQASGAATVLVLLNNDTKPASFDVGVEAIGFGDGPVLDRLNEGAPQAMVAGGRLKVTLEARSARLYTQLP